MYANWYLKHHGILGILGWIYIFYNVLVSMITTVELELEDQFSYEVRVYCDSCGDEVSEYEQKEHIKECTWK